jgi:hypothetical protein
VALDGIRALRAVPKRQLLNPRLTIGTARLAFPVVLGQGEGLVLKADNRCQVVARDGHSRTVKATGSLPNLPPGQTSVRFECDGALAHEVRVSLTRR